MRSKSVALLLVFSLSLITITPIQAAPEIKHSFKDALILMYTSDIILSGESEGEDLAAFGLPSAPPQEDPDLDLDDAKMAAILQALKDMRNQLDTNCKLLTSQYSSEGKNCEADRIQATCDQYRELINAEIGRYHKLRGDKRKSFTKAWHFLKRNGKNVWHKIGPIGRTFLRRLGPEALQIVASGGSLSGGALRKLVKQVARSLGRERIKKIVLQGVERLLKGQIEILQAAGIDVCEEPDQEQIQEVDQEPAGEMIQEEITLPDSGTWNVSCLHTYPDVIEEYGMPNWQMALNWETLTFTGQIEATSSQTDGSETISWAWYETGAGTITDDGLLWGDFVNSLTLSVQYGDNEPTITDYSYDGPWIGAISADLTRICMYRVGASDWFTLDWLRGQGIGVMLDEGSGLCEAECAAPQ